MVWVDPGELKKIYPCTIMADRYQGVYSGAPWLAWNENIYNVPGEVTEDDVTCRNFWDENKQIIVGKGNTPQEAYEDLERKLKAQ